MSLLITIVISLSIAIAFFCFQGYYFSSTHKQIKIYRNFFHADKDYEVEKIKVGNEEVTQLLNVGLPDSDLYQLIEEINKYIAKTKGTTDFAVIQNKVDRRVQMRYDQSLARISFPTYLGLMGTFLGVFIGVLAFVLGFGDAGSITDGSIKNLLIGVLVSMATSFVGLALTTVNVGFSGEARKKIEEDKNRFYDFIQTEIMPNLDVSLVSAISKLHNTIGLFEPAFNGIINNFQKTFDRCTKAFGASFETHVQTVASAVEVMGKNMDSINRNINYQEELLDTLKSKDLIKGIDRYIEASNRFVNIAQSLDVFEEARRMMLAAAREAIELQNTYNESLRIPMEVAVKVNNILDRVSTFETSVNELGAKLNSRDILGAQIVEKIERQINAISQKSSLADRYAEQADAVLEDMYKDQTMVINDLSERYKKALERHINGFEERLLEQKDEVAQLHKDLLDVVKEKFSVDTLQDDFQYLKKLEVIDESLTSLNSCLITPDDFSKLLGAVESLKGEIKELRDLANNAQRPEKSTFGSWFTRR